MLLNESPNETGRRRLLPLVSPSARREVVIDDETWVVATDVGEPDPGQLNRLSVMLASLSSLWSRSS